MNAATSLYVGNIKQSVKKSTDYITLTGTISNLAANSTSNFNFTGYDSNFTSASGGQGVALTPGVYEAVCNVSFPQPIVSPQAAFTTVNLAVTGTNAAINPTSVQTNAVYNGWQSGYTSCMFPLVDIYMPNGGSFAPSLYQNLGATISNVNLSLTLRRVRAY